MCNCLLARHQRQACNEGEAGTLAKRLDSTRNALIDAFGDLLLRRRRRPQVTDVVRRARLSRSTFYQHFESLADVRAQSYARPLGMLARASLASDRSVLVGLLSHFAENAMRARELLAGAERSDLAAGLAEAYDALLADRMSCALPPWSYLARQLADAQLGLVTAWLDNGAAVPATIVAAELCRTARVLLVERGADERAIAS
jgi:AcrR family transcriptional regulator